MKTLFLSPVILFTVALILTSCEPSGKRPSDMTPQELVKSREVRKVSEVDILESARKKGNEISKVINKSLGKIFESLTDNQREQEAVQFYESRLQAAIDSISVEHKVRMKRILPISASSKNEIDTTEQQLMEAYAFNIQNDIPTSESVNMTADGKEVLFTKPILLNDILCGNCDENTKEYIRVLEIIYPNIEFEDTDSDILFGMWSIRLLTKDIITSMD